MLQELLKAVVLLDACMAKHPHAATSVGILAKWAKCSDLLLPRTTVLRASIPLTFKKGLLLADELPVGLLRFQVALQGLLATCRLQLIEGYASVIIHALLHDFVGLLQSPCVQNVPGPTADRRDEQRGVSRKGRGSICSWSVPTCRTSLTSLSLPS